MYNLQSQGVIFNLLFISSIEKLVLWARILYIWAFSISGVTFGKSCHAGCTDVAGNLSISVRQLHNGEPI